MDLRLAALMGGTLACAGLALGPPAAAQAVEAPGATAAPATVPDSGTQIYGPDYFREFNLTNAEDMLRRIPGVPAILDTTTNSNARGLGAGTEQILIDGKRMAGKSNSAGATLRRIPASSVERVELIRGSSNEVQSEGLLVNVVLKAGVNLGGVGNMELTYRYSHRGWSDVDALISYASTWGPLTYVIGYEKQSWSPLGLVPNQGNNDWSVRFRDERYFYPTGELMELRPQKWARQYQRHLFTANGTYPIGGDDLLRMNLLYQPNPVKQVDRTFLTRFSVAGAPTGRATEEHYNKNSTDLFELGGEASKALGPGRVSVIALHSRTGAELLDFRNRIEAATGALTEVGRSANAQHRGEDVARAAYEWSPLPGHSVQFGAEGARNFLTQNIEVFSDQNRDGRLEQIVIPTAFARVQEMRAELFVTDSWRLSSQFTLDASLEFEISRITTNYPAIPVRTLKYFKPRVDLRWTPTPRDRFRFKIERTLNQLEFGNFVPTYNIIDSRIDLGNPTLLPTRNWLYEATYERRLAGDNGTLGLRAFKRNTVGGVNFMPFGFNSAGLPISARGNNPPSMFWGIEGTASVKLGFIGLRNVQVNTRIARLGSRATDAFTGVTRKAISNWEWEKSFGFRHDLTGWNAAYGFDYLDVSGFQLVSDIRNFEYFTRGERMNLFVEKALWGDYALRFDAYSFNGAEEDRRRLIYRISQADGALTRTETYDEARDRRFSVRLRGKF